LIWDDAKYDRFFDGREKRRAKQEERFQTKLDRQMTAAEAMIGELCKEGKQVFYIYPVGGKYREGPRHELIDFLIRNKYV
jgi:hypothetical protein